MKRDIENYAARLTLLDMIGFGQLIGFNTMKKEDGVEVAETDEEVLRERLLEEFRLLQGQKARDIKKLIISVAIDNRKKGEEELKDKARYEVNIVNKMQKSKAQFYKKKLEEKTQDAAGDKSLESNEEIDEILDKGEN